MSWNTMLWPQTIEKLTPEFLHLLGFYTGNVEYQIPHGKRAAARPPRAQNATDSQSFVLGNQK